jgi:hypothetical protein
MEYDWTGTEFEELTEEDYRMVMYFYLEKGDVTRWCSWEDKQDLFKEKHPELLHAFKQVEIAEKTLNAVIEKICKENL